jgi:hypothetical protein
MHKQIGVPRQPGVLFLAVSDQFFRIATKGMALHASANTVSTFRPEMGSPDWIDVSICVRRAETSESGSSFSVRSWRRTVIWAPISRRAREG